MTYDEEITQYYGDPVQESGSCSFCNSSASFYDPDCEHWVCDDCAFVCGMCGGFSCPDDNQTFLTLEGTVCQTCFDQEREDVRQLLTLAKSLPLPDC